MILLCRIYKKDISLLNFSYLLTYLVLLTYFL